MDDTRTTLSRSAFQILAAASGKARLPIVDSLKVGTTRQLVDYSYAYRPRLVDSMLSVSSARRGDLCQLSRLSPIKSCIFYGQTLEFVHQFNS